MMTLEECKEMAKLDGEVRHLRALLMDAKLQIEYLHDKFVPTGSGVGVLGRINNALRDVD
jgi:hypothetical protein